MPTQSQSYPTTTWTGLAGGGLWETRGNWDNGIPQARWDVVPRTVVVGSSAGYAVSLNSPSSGLHSLRAVGHVEEILDAAAPRKALADRNQFVCVQENNQIGRADKQLFRQ
jgi:hypothetical protein